MRRSAVHVVFQSVGRSPPLASCASMLSAVATCGTTQVSLAGAPSETPWIVACSPNLSSCNITAAVRLPISHCLCVRSHTGCRERVPSLSPACRAADAVELRGEILGRLKDLQHPASGPVHAFRHQCRHNLGAGPRECPAATAPHGATTQAQPATPTPQGCSSETQTLPAAASGQGPSTAAPLPAPSPTGTTPTATTATPLPAAFALAPATAAAPLPSATSHPTQPKASHSTQADAS